MSQNRLIVRVALLTLLAALNACGTTEKRPANVVTHQDGTKGVQQKQLRFQLASGVYRCEQGQTIEVFRDTRNANLIELNWQSNRYSLQRYDSASGLPRFEDRQNGLLWIDLPWKSVLIDVNSGQPLVNECKAARG